MSQTRPTAARRLRVPAACLLLVALAACARDAGDWKAAQGLDTQEAYESFIAQHPDSAFVPQAKTRAMQLVEERDWAAATQADTPEAYRQFIGQHPDGKWTQEARIRVENFNVLAAVAPDAHEAAVRAAPAAPVPAAAPAAVSATAPAPAPRSAGPAPAAPPAAPRPLATASAAPASPAVKPVSVATPSAASTALPAPSPPGPGGPRVQLGAFSSVDKAEAEWSRARDRFPALQALEPRITAAETRAGRLFRLQAGLQDTAAAADLRARLKAGGQPCLVVPAK